VPGKKTKPASLRLRDLPLTFVAGAVARRRPMASGSKSRSSPLAPEKKPAPPGAGRRPRANDLRSRSSLAALGLAWLRKFQANAHAALASRDPEFVHQLRVGLRRMRGLHGVLQAVDAGRFGPEYSASRDAMRWIAGVLGASRDADVFVHETLPILSVDLAKTVRAQLRRRALNYQARQREHTGVVLAGTRFGSLPALIGAAFAAPATRSPDERDDRVRRALGDLLERRARRARKCARHTETASAEALHHFRIEVKKLRYLSQVAAPLHDEAVAQPYLVAVENLQALLGEMQDLATAQRLVSELAQQAGDSAATMVAPIEKTLNVRRALLLEHIVVSAREFRRLRPFWRVA